MIKNDINLTSNLDAAPYKEILQYHHANPIKSVLALKDIHLLNLDKQQIKIFKDQITNLNLEFYDYFSLYNLIKPPNQNNNFNNLNNFNLMIQDSFNPPLHAKKFLYSVFGKEQFKLQLKYPVSCWLINFQQQTYLCYSDQHNARPSVSLIACHDQLPSQLSSNNLNIIKENDLFDQDNNSSLKLQNNSVYLGNLIKLNQLLNNFFNQEYLILIEQITESKIVNQQIKHIIKHKKNTIKNKL